MKSVRKVILGTVLFTAAVSAGGAAVFMVRRTSTDGSEGNGSSVQIAQELVTFSENDSELQKLSSDEQADQLLRKAAYLRSQKRESEALKILDDIEARLSIAGWEVATYSERIRIYKATGQTDKQAEYEQKLKAVLVANGSLGESDILPDVDSSSEGG
jgi:hypothetical protein